MTGPLARRCAGTAPGAKHGFRAPTVEGVACVARIEASHGERVLVVFVHQQVQQRRRAGAAGAVQVVDGAVGHIGGEVHLACVGVCECV